MKSEAQSLVDALNGMNDFWPTAKEMAERLISAFGVKRQSNAERNNP